MKISFFIGKNPEKQVLRCLALRSSIGKNATIFTWSASPRQKGHCPQALFFQLGRQMGHFSDV
jgi:hypothetical protein